MMDEPRPHIDKTTSAEAALERIRSAPHPVLVEMTAPLARLLLTLNATNRRLRRDQVRRITRDILAGHWVYDANPIVMDTSGHLVAGQHRLNALLTADEEKPGITVLTLVVTGASPRTVLTSNAAVPTGSGDVLVMRGMRNAANLAAAVRVHHAYTHGFLPTSRSQLSATSKLTAQEVIDHLDAHPGLVDSVAEIAPIRRVLQVPPTALAVAHYVLSDIDAEEAATFFRRIQKFELHGESDPVTIMVQRVQSEIINTRASLRASTGLFMLFRAWNAVRTGEKMTKFQLYVRGNPQKMPVPV